MEANENPTINHLLLTSNDKQQSNEFDQRIKTDFISYCYSFVRDDDEARQCIENVWKKYLTSVGEVPMVNLLFFIFRFCQFSIFS